MEAGLLATELDRLNRERQAIEQAALADAEAQALHTLDLTPDASVIVVAAADWHPGIVGLIAARLKERFRRPAFAFTLNADGTATGSGRSVPGVDLGRAVRAAVEAGLALKGGGHAMAAGVTIRAGDLESLRRLPGSTPRRSGRRRPGVRHARGRCGRSPLAGAGAGIVVALERAGPFGSGQPEPVFVFPHHRLVEAREVGSGGHIRIKLRGRRRHHSRRRCLSRSGPTPRRCPDASLGNDLHVAGTLSVDRWGGQEKVALRVVDVALT